MDHEKQLILFAFIGLLVCLLYVVSSPVERSRRQVPCDQHFKYNSLDVINQTVTANCRYYGDRFYECTAWNRMLARNHWVTEDGIIPLDLWTNQNERVRIAECKFYENYQYRCRQTPTCIGTYCPRKSCPWGGSYEGTPHAGFKMRTSSVSQPEPYTVVYSLT